MEADESEKKAMDWLAQRGVLAAGLKRMGGYSNHVYRVKQDDAALSVLRIPDDGLSPELCPLAHDAARIFKIHQEAFELGIAPEVLETDLQTGIMWLQHAGEVRSLTKGSFTEWQSMILRLQNSGFDWNDAQGQSDAAGLAYLRQLSESNIVPESRIYAESLLRPGIERGYAEYPLVPVHGDLNPGNYLYQKEYRHWYVIDWDFAGMKAAEWEYAALIVEHGWDIELAVAFAHQVNRADLVWFCATFALLSWEWHVQRESAALIVSEKWRTVEYWFSCL